MRLKNKYHAAVNSREFLVAQENNVGRRYNYLIAAVILLFRAAACLSFLFIEVRPINGGKIKAATINIGDHKIKYQK